MSVTKEKIDEIIAVLRRGWCVDWCAMDADGVGLSNAFHPKAAKWCLRGAVHLVFGPRFGFNPDTSSHFSWGETIEAAEFDRELGDLIGADIARFNNTSINVDEVIDRLLEIKEKV